MAADNNGWVKLNRKMLDNKYWFSERFTHAQAWIDLILTAQWQDDENGTAGAVYTSTLALAKRWKWSRGKVLRFLKSLEQDGSIKTEMSKNDGTTVLLENWGKYQHGRTTNDDDGTTNSTTNSTTNGTTNSTTVLTANSNKTRRRRTTNSTTNSTTNDTTNGTTKEVYYNNIVYTKKKEIEEKKKDQPHDAHANAASAEWKTDDPRVPIEYRPDFDSYEQYMRWRNQ